jgi:hypothetical protein
MPQPVLSVVTTQVVPGNSGVTLLARIQNYQGVLITQASLSAIALTVTDLTLEGNVAGSGFISSTTLTISQVIFDSLQQNSGIWTKDSALFPGSDGRWGYNFAFTVPVTALANPGDRMQVDVAFTPVTGPPFRIPYIWNSLKVYG